VSGNSAYGTVPSSRTITRHVTDLGKGARREYFNLREKYKGEGLSPRQAIERAYTELNVERRWYDQRHRQRTQAAFGDGLPLTPGEMGEVLPTHTELRIDKAVEIGHQEMGMSEAVKWAMKEVARVQNGEPPPTRFPNEAALFWFQSAVSNRRDFERLVLRVEAPGGDVDNLFLQDSQYQFSEIEKQIQMAVKEVGPRIRELEKKYFEVEKE
jgi:hypothetical protein